jgi:predicted RNA binding protein YcfA (HicA-like mRNA interferase family)
MTRLPPVSAREVIRVLLRAGFVLKRTTGGHQHFRHPDQSGLVTVPHHRGDLDPKVLRSIIRQAGMTPEEFLKRL